MTAEYISALLKEDFEPEHLLRAINALQPGHKEE